MSARLSGALAMAIGAVAASHAADGNAWLGTFLGFVAGVWFSTFVNEVWP